MQARWPPDRATISGTATEYAIVGDEGGRATFRFCPTCGATVYYTNEGSDLIAVPVGTFQEPTFPPPQYSVYTVRKHAWITIDGAIEQLD